MKFTAPQLEFLLTVADIKEAADFKPAKNVLENKCLKMKEYQVDELCSTHNTVERCVGLEKNGDRCISEMKFGDFCNRHRCPSEMKVIYNDKGYGACDECGICVEFDRLISCSCCGKHDLYSHSFWCDECEEFLCRGCESTHNRE
jgi:hypothetical protein